MNIFKLTPPPPGRVYRQPGEIVALEDGDYRIERVTECSATCRRTGTRVRSFTDTRTGKLREFKAAYTRIIHINPSRDRDEVAP